MKSITTIFLLTAMLITANAQTIYRVNNNTGVTGVNVYTTAQAAHDAAAANDIILIEGSSTSYGNLVLTKPLVIYGNGYYLNTNTELKADQKPSTVGTITFNTGSGGSSLQGGVTISSVYIQGVSNINIQRCSLSGIAIYNSNVANNVNTNVSNITITQNTFSSVSSSPASGFSISNVLITNNLMAYISGNTSDQGWVVKNNDFSIPTYISLYNAVFDSNLFPNTGGSPNFYSTSYSYNVSFGNSFSAGIGNQNNYDVTSDLATPSGAGISTDETRQLKASSALNTAANGGGQVGAFGGTTPYVISGIPAIPSIVSMFNTAIGSTTTPLSATITVKSNN